MSAPAIVTDRAAVRAKLDACYAAIGTQRSAWGMLWRRSDRAARIVLLRIAGAQPYLAERDWSALQPATRSEIKRRARDLHAWLGRVIAEADAEGAAQ